MLVGTLRRQMTGSAARVLEPRTPLAAQLLVLGLVILTVIVILPR